MQRLKFLELVRTSVKNQKVTALLGPRQCGKTTLARAVSKSLSPKPKAENYFDLEDPEDLARLDSPKLALEPLKGLVIIDEIQRKPELFSLIRTLVDRPRSPSKFLILGSASRDLLRQSSESLAGRIRTIELTAFQASETKHLKKLWQRGGFPNSFLAKTEKESYEWRKDYIQSFLERDLPSLGIDIPAPTMRRFWMMLVHYHGQHFKASEIGKSMGVAHTTVQRYLDILTETFMVRSLSPWLANIKKRQIKAPKIYIRDSGILHCLLQVKSISELRLHPKLGASWEGFAIEEIARYLNLRTEESYFWGVHEQSELDLFTEVKSKQIGFEFKFSDAPTLSSSMKNAMQTLKLHKLWVIYPGSKPYDLSPDIHVVPLSSVVETKDFKFT